MKNKAAHMQLNHLGWIKNFLVGHGVDPKVELQGVDSWDDGLTHKSNQASVWAMTNAVADFELVLR